MTKDVPIGVIFNEPCPLPYTLKMFEPRRTTIMQKRKEGFNFVVELDPHRTAAINVVFKLNGKRIEQSVLTQFCPCCVTLLNTWPTVNVGGVPFGICPVCGGSFTARQHLMQLMDQITNKKRIIMPGKQGYH